MSGSRVFVAPEEPFDADVGVPGDKSLSHRALIFSAMARGASTIGGAGPGADIASTAAALKALGVAVSDDGGVASSGIEGWRRPNGPLDAGNSGTTMRLLAGALAGRPFTTTLIGDQSLMARPMRRLVGPLGALGATIKTGAAGRPPLVVQGAALVGTSVELPIASAQVRSAVALAALQAQGPTVIDSPPGFRDHTERALRAAGRGRWLSDTAFEVLPGELQPQDRSVPGDPSSAAFLLAAAALRPEARVTVRGICLNPGRTGFFDVLSAMGASVEVTETGVRHGEPVGAVSVIGGRLVGATIAGSLTVRCLDELPLVAVLGGVAEGPTTVSDAGELRAKESDRIVSIASMVGALGGEVVSTPDGFTIRGGAEYRPATIDAAGDHRIAMAAAVAATAAGSVEIRGASAVTVSWPGFDSALEAVWSSR